MNTLRVKVVAPKVSDSKVELKFLVEGEITDWSYIFDLMKKRGQMLDISYGSPQMEMDLQPAPNGRPGVVATINGQGEVERVMRNIAEEDEDAESVLVQEGEEDGEQTEVDFEDPNHDPDPETDENQDSQPDMDPAADADTEGESTGEVDPQELERYILAVRPMWDDIPYDFPALIERKKAEGLAWYQVAKELSTSSTMLQAAYSKYKKRCKEQMLNGAA